MREHIILVICRAKKIPSPIAEMVPDLNVVVGAEPEAGREVNEIPEDQEIDFVTLGMFIIGRFSADCRVVFVVC